MEQENSFVLIHSVALFEDVMMGHCVTGRLHLECVKAGWGDMRQLQCDGPHLLLDGGVRVQLRGGVVVVVADFGGGLVRRSENGLGLPAGVTHRFVGKVPLVAPDRHGLSAGVMMCAGILGLRLLDTSENLDDVTVALVENAWQGVLWHGGEVEVD